jgi:ATP-binding cassette subfamily B protein
MLFTPKLISDSFKAIEAFSENKDIAASVIREELIRNILLIIATTIIAGFNVLNATDSHRYV